MILDRSICLTAIGLAIGLAGTRLLGKYLETLLFGVEPADPATIALVTTLLLAVAFAASVLPARRAAQVDPLISLRYE